MFDAIEVSYLCGLLEVDRQFAEDQLKERDSDYYKHNLEIIDSIMKKLKEADSK